jgi:hypothetical protein
MGRCRKTRSITKKPSIEGFFHFDSWTFEFSYITKEKIVLEEFTDVEKAKEFAINN